MSIRRRIARIRHFTRPRLVVALACCLALSASAQAARADIFQLANEGRIEGKLLNPDEQPREKYVIQTKTGGRITLAADAVVEVVRQTNAQTQDEVMASRGYVRYKGRWMLPQKVELIEERRKTEEAEAEWRGKFKRWRDWLDTDRREEAIEQLRAVRDPDALPALTRALHDDPNEVHRALYAQAASSIATPKALALLVQLSLEDPNEEVRLTALDYLAIEKHPDVVAQYVAALRSKENASVNRAADCLRVMRSETAIEPLIDALVTTHKHKIVSGSPDMINSSFNTTPGGGGGASPGGLSVGQSTRIITERLQNQAVLDALIKLTGVNFDFDIPSWKNWLAARKAPADLDARRD